MNQEYNKNCKSIVIFCYPTYAGGKFLINSLGLSQYCYLQEINLLRQQRSIGLSPEQKLNLLLNRLEDEQENWKDLNLGCNQLFGNVTKPNKFYSDINEISYEDNLFFAVSHCLQSTNDTEAGFFDLLKIWPNAKTVFLKNSNDFVNYRLGFDAGFDRLPYLHLPQNFTKDQEQSILQTDNLLVWDVAWYFDQQKYIQELMHLYDQLGLPDFNQELLQVFHGKYMDKIQELRNIKRKLYFDNSN